ncbi:MAG: IreB family regulatory phosphoprotein [Oscillospiraceae bacterium]|nr:IreB family regulatory phosphoprotein [Oscillospiraceae bacterium]
MSDGDTMKFRIPSDRESEMKQILTEVYDALREKGYDPVSQIVGYILTEDPGYITNYKNARSMIRHIDRDELLQSLLKNYLTD